MPTVSEQIVLGKNQTLTLDGEPLDGVREVDVDIDTTTFEVTRWDGSWRSHLPLMGDATIRILIYWKSTWETFSDKLLNSPREPMTLSVSNALDWRVVVSGVRVAQPINGVVSWEVTFKPYWYA